MKPSSKQGALRVAALYRFCRLERFAQLRAPLRAFCEGRGIKGTLLLAPEGINGTVAGGAAAIEELILYLDGFPELAGLEIKLSACDVMPFHRFKVRLKREIVTMGIEGIDAAASTGSHVEPRDWNRLAGDPKTVMIDTRNEYEVSLGSFEGAVNPGTASFSAFPAWVEANRNRLAGRRIALFCTGGIRCEKATAYMRWRGFEDVFQLKGGILRYLEDVPRAASLWRGECFVFDERVSVGHGLETGEAKLCRACRHPLNAADLASPKYREGVSCARCFDLRSEADRRRYAERQRQVELARGRGAVAHIGS